MIGDPRERWKELCEQAAKEPNAAKLLAMVREINDLIDARYARARSGLAFDFSRNPSRDPASYLKTQ